MVTQCATRSGMTRLRLVLTVAGGLLALVVVGFGLEVISFYQALKHGGTNPLAALQFPDKLTLTGEGASAETTSVDMTTVMSETAPTLGNENAPITLVEFADFGCPFSRDESSILREALAEHPDVFKLQFRDFPLDELHPTARHAAFAGRCAHEQGKFWAMHDKLFANQDDHTDADLVRYAKEIGLDTNMFNSCFTSAATASTVATSVEVGAAAGVRGTPTFVINGTRIEGAIPKEAWENIASLVQN